ncbi:calcium-translocating P-type ATPase, SERCA-type [Candidatus Woesearchaeota archaeon]|nr:calcium-translocating P-type ATPase, SERCA-type [Candidatus Woesearchaeota archaeon]
MEHYKETLKDLYTAYSTTAEGLSLEEAARRLQKYGRNELAEEKGEPWWKLLLGQFNSPVIWVLLGAVIVSAFIGFTSHGHEAAEAKIDALMIAIILILNAIIGFYQEYKAEQAIEALKKMAGLKATVIRNGKQTKIDAAELVPGDVIILETGEKIPADSRLIEAINLETQEAALTGESNPVTKEAGDLSNNRTIGDRTNMVHSSTIITRGHGKALVVGTGMQTEIGKIAHMIQTTKTEQTPLQKQLSGLGKWLGILTILVCAIVFAAGMLMHEGTALELFITAVALAVAAIPEGLPAVVTISLSLGVKRMVKRNALMRHLPSVETLGCTTVICSDKTGTLTHNQMTVKRLFVSGRDIEVAGSGYNPEGKIGADNKSVEMLLRIGAQNNDAKLDREKWTCMGDPTEGCLITAALKAGLDKTKLDRENPRVDELPFDSERKMMTTVHKAGSKRVAYVKGAPDMLLSNCTKIWIDGKVRKLAAGDKKKIMSQNEAYAKKALRVLGFAYKDLPANAAKKGYEKDLIFVGLQAMIDPPREEVKEAIARCKEAGIKVVMITGDLRTTAEAIAAELGISGKAMTGAELQKMNEKDLEKTVEEVAIYARVNPEHKMKIVTALQAKGHVVAMTGDGVNDAPALKKADIGISMGITGTDVAKEASEMILTDDNFTSIVNAVEEGRGIYDNIRKFVNYLLSCNVGEVLLIFTATLMGIPLPLIAVHLLWVNLVTDGFPAGALGVDPVSPDAMKRPPRKVRSRIMSLGMSLNVFTMGILIAVATLVVYYIGLLQGIEMARTMAFTTIVMLEIVRIGMIRSAYHTGMFSNNWLVLAVLSSVGLQLLVVYTPLSAFFRTLPLGLSQWGVIGIGLVVVLAAGMGTTKIIKKISHEAY